MKRSFEEDVEKDEIKAKRLRAYENILTADRLRKQKYCNSNWLFFNNLAFNYDPKFCYRNSELLKIGKLDVKCSHCGAVRFKREPKGICCANGKVKLETLKEPPKYLQNLLNGHHEFSSHFMTNIRSYNNAFSFTSFGTSVKTQALTGFRPVFKVQGKVYHLIGSLLPCQNEIPKFAQIYFMDDKTEQVDVRMSGNNVLKPTILERLERMMQSHNSYAKSLKYAMKQMDSDSLKIVINANVGSTDRHHRRTINAPIRSEVAAIVCDYDGNHRDIIISKKDSQLQRITETHRSYDALQYPLMHPYGENGYSIDIQQVNERGNRISKTVSCKQFYSYRLMTRETNFFLKYGNLLNQYLVDVYAKIETERLLYIKNNQTKLRVENYVHLKDSIHSDLPSNSVGKLIVLPATFTGSPRYLHQYTQDAMTYVRHGGKPTFFITYTCNPKDEELLSNIDGQPAHLRQEMIARVFHQKLLIFHDLIVKGQLFGEVKYYLFAVEWQKRGLPHIHILLWFTKMINPNDIDKLIFAEIPNYKEDSELFELVTRNMIHGPCGSINESCPCMNDSKCSKNYPKNFINNTQVGNDGYPNYRRRNVDNGGMVATLNIKVNNKWSPFVIDNRWVVPYNPVLLKIFRSHINVEWCKSVSSIKYILKYITKGPDYASFKIVNTNMIDEISNYQTGRYFISE